MKLQNLLLLLIFTNLHHFIFGMNEVVNFSQEAADEQLLSIIDNISTHEQKGYGVACNGERVVWKWHPGEWVFTEGANSINLKNTNCFAAQPIEEAVQVHQNKNLLLEPKYRYASYSWPDKKNKNKYHKNSHNNFESIHWSGPVETSITSLQNLALSALAEQNDKVEFLLACQQPTYESYLLNLENQIYSMNLEQEKKDKLFTNLKSKDTYERIAKCSKKLTNYLLVDPRTSLKMDERKKIIEKYIPQNGGKHQDSKVLKGFHGASVLEIKISDKDDQKILSIESIFDNGQKEEGQQNLYEYAMRVYELAFEAHKTKNPKDLQKLRQHIIDYHNQQQQKQSILEKIINSVNTTTKDKPKSFNQNDQHKLETKNQNEAQNLEQELIEQTRQEEELKLKIEQENQQPTIENQANRNQQPEISNQNNATTHFLLRRLFGLFSLFRPSNVLQGIYNLPGIFWGKLFGF